MNTDGNSPGGTLKLEIHFSLDLQYLTDSPGPSMGVKGSLTYGDSADFLAVEATQAC